MSDERLAALEARLAQAEARLAILEARPLPLSPSIQFTNPPAPNGYNCVGCGTWVPLGTSHSCVGSYKP